MQQTIQGDRIFTPLHPRIIFKEGNTRMWPGVVKRHSGPTPISSRNTHVAVGDLGMAASAEADAGGAGAGVAGGAGQDDVRLWQRNLSGLSLQGRKTDGRQPSILPTPS